MPLKLGSNWKSCGIGTEMRRWDHGNGRINFGFCKGDDNFGGRKRKELDDFCKSLGKQMSLVMYRMQDTERVRTKLREDRRFAVREKAELEEHKEKSQMERIERNRKWRERKFGKEKLENIEEDKVLDDKEQRKIKNKEWREKRESSRNGTPTMEQKPDIGMNQGFQNLVLTELLCPFCHKEMCPPAKVFQCEEGHNLCDKCMEREDMKACPLCMGKFSGRNTAVEEVAALLFSKCGFGTNLQDQEQESRSFTFITNIDSGLVETPNKGPTHLGFDSLDVLDIEEILVDTEGETLRIQ